ncbi:hypothetical protein PODOV084v1_p0039 [Vibrio phage 340E47.2]|nr:hypothetical protein PODOV084v1_p0039 [Vibrio phage 340E47.2]QZI91945.1 hypothetical protein PODOV077v1_p0034 [Vibrio phage 5P1a]
MNELIELLMSAATCDQQQDFMDYEARFISGEDSAETCQNKMRKALFSWCESQVSSEGFDISHNGDVIYINFLGTDYDFSMAEGAEKIITLLDCIRKFDRSELNEFIESL